MMAPIPARMRMTPTMSAMAVPEGIDSRMLDSRYRMSAPPAIIMMIPSATLPGDTNPVTADLPRLILGFLEALGLSLVRCCCHGSVLVGGSLGGTSLVSSTGIGPCRSAPQ